MDHVHNLAAITGEMLRILKPGGLLIGSFNMDEEAGVSEPITLTPELLEANLLRHLDVSSRRVAPKGPNNAYEYFFSAAPPGTQGTRLLWVHGTRKAELQCGGTKPRAIISSIQ